MRRTMDNLERTLEFVIEGTRLTRHLTHQAQDPACDLNAKSPVGRKLRYMWVGETATVETPGGTVTVKLLAVHETVIA